jgi:hypothetical protein
MSLNRGRITVTLLALLALACLAADASPKAKSYALPNPVLYLVRTEAYQTGGKTFIRYNYMVDNSGAYPDSIFAAAPSLPPCGKNANSSRTWVDVYQQDGKRLYGFCSFAKASDLNGIWFALEDGVVPPSWVYIELNDRATDTKYKSNLAETSL